MSATPQTLAQDDPQDRAPDDGWMEDAARRKLEAQTRLADIWAAPPGSIEPQVRRDQLRAFVGEYGLQALLDDETEIGYAEAAEMIDRMPQSLRSAMMRRRRHERDEGKARATDILEPHDERYAWPRTEPVWRAGAFRAWAMQRDKLAKDGITPQPYRGSEKKRRGYREAHGLPVPTGKSWHDKSPAA